MPRAKSKGLEGYHEFLRSKIDVVKPSGFEIGLDDINRNCFEWQKHCIRWAVRRGKCALFLDTGLGKTLCQLEFARIVAQKTEKPVLLVAPLAVCRQTEDEHQKFGIESDVRVIKYSDELGSGINITNYERIERYNPELIGGLILDESSIIKSFEGKFRNYVCTAFRHTPYKLACSATPSPNDFMELGNHAEFLNAMSRTEMLSTYFVHDSSDTSKWRLKKHAERDFWWWVSSWALMLNKPSDIGFDDTGYDLPGLRVHHVEIPWHGDEAKTLVQQKRVRKASVLQRVEKLAQEIITDNEPWIIWCDLNDESVESTKAIIDAVEVTGSMAPNEKSGRMRQFSRQEIRVLVTKPKISGFGMNWQHCNKQAFVGLSHSFESFYQAVRRSLRFGQEKVVDVHVIITDKEGPVLDNVMRKQADLKTMQREMISHMSERIRSEMFGVESNQETYEPSFRI